jgi:DNA-binding HxlR family transcriptional regulator
MSDEKGSVSACPVERAIQVIGGKWKLLLLRSLVLNGSQRYNELLASVTGISAKELTRNLRELEAAGLVVHAASSDGPVKYALTAMGEGLMPTFQTLLTWGRQLL